MSVCLHVSHFTPRMNSADEKNSSAKTSTIKSNSEGLSSLKEEVPTIAKMKKLNTNPIEGEALPASLSDKAKFIEKRSLCQNLRPNSLAKFKNYLSTFWKSSGNKEEKEPLISTMNDYCDVNNGEINNCNDSEADIDEPDANGNDIKKNHRGWGWGYVATIGIATFLLGLIAKLIFSIPAASAIVSSIAVIIPIVLMGVMFYCLIKINQIQEKRTNNQNSSQIGAPNLTNNVEDDDKKKSNKRDEQLEADKHHEQNKQHRQLNERVDTNSQLLLQPR